jgi:hypothetical protein
VLYLHLGCYVHKLTILTLQSEAPTKIEDDAILPITPAATNVRKQPLRRTQQTIQQTIQQAFTPTASTAANNRRAALAKKEAELYAASLNTPDSDDVLEEDISATGGAGTLKGIARKLRAVKSELRDAVVRDTTAGDDHVNVGLISYGYNLPPNIRKYDFKNPINPNTRVRQFEHLKDRQLYDAIKDLPPWQQMQELFPWFNAFDVLIVYLVDEENLLITTDPALHGLKHIQNVLLLMGISPKLFKAEYAIQRKRAAALRWLPTVLKVVKNHTPRASLPPSGLLELTIPVPGPIDRTYTVINQAMPLTLLAGKPIHTARNDSCVLAQMEFFQDERARKKLITKTFSRLNIIDPSVKPWKLGQKITDVNPHILRGDHYLQKNCTPAFWNLKFESDPDAGNGCDANFRFFCREHNRFENTRNGTYQLLMALAMGFFGLSDWVEVCSVLNDPVKDAKGHRMNCGKFISKPIYHLLTLSAPTFANVHAASHKCGNGEDSNDKNKAVCCNPFCIVFESHNDNGSRVDCHHDFAEKGINGIDASEMSCFCGPGLAAPCLTGRSDLTAYDLRDQLLEHYNGIRNEHDDNDDNTNRIGRCPYPDCNFEILKPCNLRTYFKYENINKFVTHGQARQWRMWTRVMWGV